MKLTYFLYLTDQLNLLKACVRESMRLFQPVSPGTEREMTEDIVLSGYHVPAGTSVIMSSVSTSRNPCIYPDPHSFKPDRWLRVDKKKRSETSDNHTEMDLQAVNPRLAGLASIPFGHGSRSCVGRRFAELEMYVGIAKVLQKLSVSIDPEYEGLEVIYTPFVTAVDNIPFIFKEHSGSVPEFANI